MADPIDRTDAPRYLVKVQRLTNGFDTDEYVVDEGYTPMLSTTEEQELWVTKTNDEGGTATIVVVYAYGTWLRGWVEDDTDTETEGT